MAKTAEDGTTVRAHLEARARHSEVARRELEGPACPEGVGYLVAWACALHGRSGIVVGMEGGVVLPLSFTTVAAWARLMGIRVQPYEVEALMELDAALREPEEPVVEAEVEAVVETPAWPTRKPGVTPVLIRED